jgi:hypothetical protein
MNECGGRLAGAPSGFGARGGKGFHTGPIRLLFLILALWIPGCGKYAVLTGQESLPRFDFTPDTKVAVVLMLNHAPMLFHATGFNQMTAASHQPSWELERYFEERFRRLLGDDSRFGILVLDPSHEMLERCLHFFGDNFGVLPDYINRVSPQAYPLIESLGEEHDADVLICVFDGFANQHQVMEDFPHPP